MKQNIRIVPRKFSNEEFVVGGAHAFLLRVSSIFGLAPLRFQPQGDGYVVSISIPMCIYSYILVILISGIAIYSGLEKKSQMSDNLPDMVLYYLWVSQNIKAAVGVFAAPLRMKCMFKCMRTVAMVDQNIDVQYSQKKEYRIRWCLVVLSLMHSFLTIHDFVSSIAAVVETDVELSQRRYIELIHDGICFLLHLLTGILQIQFMFATMTVYSRFKAINRILTTSTSHFAIPFAEKANDLNTLNVYAVFAAYAVSEPNVIVVRESGTGVPRPLSTKPLTDTVQHIAIVRNSLCEAVHYINMSYGLSLVLLVKSLLIEVIFDLYLAIFERNNPIPRGSPIVYFEFMQFVWFSLHFVSLFILVDSSNRTTEEGNKTESIIKRMLLESPLRGPLASRLELFSRQLMLQRVGYRPLGLFSLNRTLVVSILGIIMTYLVILLQFENN